MNIRRVIEMDYVKRTRCPVRHGEEAIDALHKYVEEINGEESGELTERQKAALTRVAQALISSLETEVRGDGGFGNISFPVELGEIKKAILKPLHEPSHQNIERQPISSHPYLHYELPMREQIR